MDRNRQLKFLLVMAASDGGLSAEELQFLSDRAKKWGISIEDFAQIVDEATGNDVELTIPESKADRLTVLADLVRMMGADGELHAKEKELFALIAARMDISDDEVNRVIDEAVR